MTDKITLELTLEELKLIDKYVEYDHNTVPLIKKIKDAYPKSKTLTDLIYDWWEDVFGNTDDTETCIDDLVTRIEEWLPKEQSAAGSQNVYVECTVEGFNDCLNKIKSKLR